MRLPEDIVDFVRRNFPAQDQEPALHALLSARTHDDNNPAPRLLRCAIMANTRNLESLRYHLEGLSIDYRDVILAGEYKREKGDWKRLRDLNLPFTKDDV